MAEGPQPTHTLEIKTQRRLLPVGDHALTRQPLIDKSEEPSVVAIGAGVDMLGEQALQLRDGRISGAH
jgi:hypothetical protein